MAYLLRLFHSLPPAAVVQGAVWVVLVGLWPLLAYRLFEKVTGPKTDSWLVRTVAGLGLTIGSTLLAQTAAGRARAPETALLGLGALTSLGVADVYYSTTGRISKVYLLDTLEHLAIAALWVRDLRESEHGRTRASTPEGDAGARPGQM